MSMLEELRYARFDSFPDVIDAGERFPVVRRNDGIMNHFTGAGGPEDKGEAGRPSIWDVDLSDEECKLLHKRNALARRIATLPVTRATRKWWAVPDITPTIERELRLYKRIPAAMIWARTFGGCGALIVTDDDVSGPFRKDPVLWRAQPLKLERVGKVRAVQVFDCFQCYPHSYDEDIRSPTYGEPLYWRITHGRYSGLVHASRILHFRGALRVPSETTGFASFGGNIMPDDSIFQSIWAEVRRMSEINQAGAVLATEIRESVLKIGGLKNIAVGSEAPTLMSKVGMIAKVRSILNIIMLGPDDEYETRSNPATGYKELSDAAKAMLSAAADIPETLLYGQAPSGLNTDGESSHESFRQSVSDLQEDNREVLERLYEVIYASQEGPTRGRIPDREEWEVSFHELDEPKQIDVATLRKTVAEMDVLYIREGVYSAEEIAEQRFGADGWKLDLEEVEILDPLEQAELDAEIAAKVAEANPPLAGVGNASGAAGGNASKPGLGNASNRARDDDSDEMRLDAATGTAVLIPAAETGLKAAIERAIGQTIEAETDPHVTVAFLGEGHTAAELMDLVKRTQHIAENAEPGTVLSGAVVRSFKHGKRGTPIVVEFREAWGLERLEQKLIRSIAHLMRVPMFPNFRPHLTIGYAPAPLTPEALAALLAIDVHAIRVAVVELEVRQAGAIVDVAAVGG